MLRIITVCVFVASLFVAGVLYKIKYDTRALQREAYSLRKAIKNEQKQLAIVKAEWSFLTRPQEVDRFARSLSLEPLEARQIVSFQDLDQLPMKKQAAPNVVALQKGRGREKDQDGLTELFDLSPLYSQEGGDDG